jgi:hypothetical protein
VNTEIDDIIRYAKFTDGELSSSDVMKLVEEIERLRPQSASDVEESMRKAQLAARMGVELAA